MIITKICDTCKQEFKCETNRLDGSRHCDCEPLGCQCLPCWIRNLNKGSLGKTSIQNYIYTAHKCFETVYLKEEMEEIIKGELRKIIDERALIDL